VEGAFGAVGLVAGAFDSQLGGACRAGVAGGDLVGGREGQGELIGLDGG